MKKILLVFGTRPEAIKLCPLILRLRQRKDQFKTVVCVTAQHRQMLDQFLSLFDVTPDYDLNLMRPNQSLCDLTSVALIEIAKIVDKEKPDLVIVQGDTTTTFVASLAAYYNEVGVGHVEAGLRTHDKYSPFPEEINRRITSVIADIHFAPTELSKRNLLAEGVPGGKIFVTGNTVIDALLWVREKIKSENRRYHELEEIDFDKQIILVTGHRRENFGKEFINVCSALRRLATQNEKCVEIVYPVHLNPNVREPVFSILGGIGNVRLLEPLDYEPFVYLMDKCHLIISDSGGIQEEAPSLGKPVLVTRNTTERPEAVQSGVIKLVGTNEEEIVHEAQRLLSDRAYYDRMANVQNPYGDGRACERIVDELTRFVDKVE